ncbi:MAG TPA: hypothetical protein VJ750_12060 [Rhizomicrobium sp.]|nr:hypothetical protein [Rhizomicrobium sp.]
MNPELQRNLWLEATPFRLALIAGLLMLVFLATSVAPIGLATRSGAALTLYWFFAVLWGTRSAALSVVAEIRERTWDGQKLSAIAPWQMVWGKLFGATAANWFGTLLCLPFVLLPVWQKQGLAAALTYGVILLSLGVFAQAIALLSSLVLIRRNTGNWRLDIFLCQVAGICAAFAYYALWERSGSQTLNWWGQEFNLSRFHLASLLVFLAWALVGCWRAMRAELRVVNGPYVWLAYLAYLSLYNAGFQLPIGRHLDIAGLYPSEVKLVLAEIALLAAAYGMAFLEPKDPVRLRWLGERVRAGQFYKAFLAADAWMLAYGAALLVGLLLAAVSAALAQPLALSVLAMLGFLTRDITIFVLMRSMAGAKGDFAALAVLGALYLLLPMILTGVHPGGWTGAFLPVPASALGVILAWAQGVACAVWAARSIARDQPAAAKDAVGQSQ